MSKEWFQGAAVVAGTIHTVVRGMSEKWFHEASVVAGTMYTVVEMSK